MFRLPIVIGKIITGLTILILLIIIFTSLDIIKQYGVYERIILIAIFSLIIGVHGILHGIETLMKNNRYGCKYCSRKGFMHRFGNRMGRCNCGCKYCCGKGLGNRFIRKL